MRAARVLQSSRAPSFIVKHCSASTNLNRDAPAAPAKPLPLKKLSLPPIGITLRKFLRSSRPFLSSDEYIRSEEIIKDFSSPGSLGDSLHTLLEERANNCPNWLEEWWLNSAYLSYRNPVVVFSSPGQVFPWQLFTADADYIMCAAKVIMGALDYKCLIDEGKMKPDMMGKEPLDMEQYSKVFGTTRIPCIPLDNLRYNPKSQHIVVVCNNEFFKVNAMKQGKPIDLSSAYHQIKYIIDNTKIIGCPIGILTTDCRDNWAVAYEHLSKDATSSATLKEIEESLFIVCLDRGCPRVLSNNKTTTAAQVIHGGGPCENSGNRWYDKTLQFVICRDGGVGIAYEHSPAEGGLIASLMDHINNILVKKMCYDEPAVVDTPRRLDFNVDECLMEFINKSSSNLVQLIENFELCCFSFDDFGKEEIKKHKLSPDSFIQMAIQYAFYRIHHVPGAQYETGSLRRFAKGRTETIRSCSEESVAFAKAMLNDCLTCVSKARALREAVEVHKQYAIEAMDMKGVDRYLLGLRLIAEESCLPRPPILDDVAFKRSTHFRLSTSQVPSKADGFMAYGAITDDGYACCYNPRDKNINFGTSTYKSTGETCVELFRENLELALRHMKNVLVESPVAKL